MDSGTLRERYGVSSVKQPVEQLGSLAGVPIYGAADWKRVAAALVATGASMALLFERDKRPLRRILSGVGYSAILAGSVATHKFGHIMSGRIIGEEMDGVIFTLPAPIELYAKRGRDLSLRQHQIRAAGGPLANLAVGLVTHRLASATGFCFARATARIHLAHAAGSLTPVMGLDGEVILRGRADGIDLREK